MKSSKYEGKLGEVKTETFHNSMVSIKFGPQDYLDIMVYVPKLETCIAPLDFTHGNVIDVVE